VPSAVQMETGRQELSRNPTAHGPEVDPYDLYVGPTMSEATTVAHGRKLELKAHV